MRAPRLGSAVLTVVLLSLLAGACGDKNKTDQSGGGGGTETTSDSSRSKVGLVDIGVDLPTGVVEFGAPMEEAVAKLTAGLGKPTEDTGLVEPRRSYGRCPGTKVRALRYFGGALELLFGDAPDTAASSTSSTRKATSTTAAAPKMVFHTWTLTTDGDRRAAPRVSVLIGDVTTFDFGVGTTVKEFKKGLADEGGYSFETFDSADGPTFVVALEGAGQDPGPGMPESIRGTLSSEDDAGTAKLVEGGAGCDQPLNG